MPHQTDPDQPAPIRLIVVETPIPGVLIGIPALLTEPADPEVGWTTTDDNDW